VAEREEAHSGEGEAASHHKGRPNVLHDGRHDERANNEAPGGWQRPEPRVPRRESEYELQILGDEQEGREVDKEAEPVRCKRRAEGRYPEEAQIDQWIRQRPLPVKERDASDRSRQHRHYRMQDRGVHGNLLDPVDDGQDSRHRQTSAQPVQPAGG
jgi:hypothetical protein